MIAIVTASFSTRGRVRGHDLCGHLAEVFDGAHDLSRGLYHDLSRGLFRGLYHGLDLDLDRVRGKTCSAEAATAVHSPPFEIPRLSNCRHRHPSAMNTPSTDSRLLFAMSGRTEMQTVDLALSRAARAAQMLHHVD